MLKAKGLNERDHPIIHRIVAVSYLYTTFDRGFLISIEDKDNVNR